MWDKEGIWTYYSTLFITHYFFKKSDATDIKNMDEYKKFMKKYVLLKKSSTRPKKVMVWLDIKEVKPVYKMVSASE